MDEARPFASMKQNLRTPLTERRQSKEEDSSGTTAASTALPLERFLQGTGEESRTNSPAQQHESTETPARSVSWTEDEILEQLRRYNSGEDRPPWTGAVPDMSKLAASTQMDTMGLWWGWDAPDWFRQSSSPMIWHNWVPQRRCDFCIYEAGGFYQGIYFCRFHEHLVI